VPTLVGHAVKGVDFVPHLVEPEPREHVLDPQVVLLVDHDRDVFLRADGHAPGALAAGELARDDLPLHQELAIERLEGVDVEVRQVKAGRGDGRLEV